MKFVRLLFALAFLTLPAQAQYGGGTGEPNDSKTLLPPVVNPVTK
jgi:hypothetical protein